jgi:hypothetical protein
VLSVLPNSDTNQFFDGMCALLWPCPDHLGNALGLFKQCFVSGLHPKLKFMILMAIHFTLPTTGMISLPSHLPQKISSQLRPSNSRKIANPANPAGLAQITRI